MSADIADALRMILLTGQRPGEVAGATRREFVAFGKPAETRWELPAECTKARRQHIVPVGRMAVQLLYGALKRREGDGECETVFASRFTSRATLARHSLSQGLARVVQRLNVEGPDAEAVRTLKDKPPTPHDFRRTVATGMAALAFREDRLAVLGHLPADVHGTHYDRYERLKEKRIALETGQRHVAEVLWGG